MTHPMAYLGLFWLNAPRRCIRSFALARPGAVVFKSVALPPLQDEAAPAPAPEIAGSWPRGPLMEPSSDVLVKTDWTTPDGVVRMKFRRDGTGYYEREPGGGARLIHENLLWKLEGATLHLKFAHARLWTEVGVDAHVGVASEDGRFGHQVLGLAHDPYARTLEETLTESLSLQSDRGAALPS